MEVQVAIIGAGISGLKAAQKLIEGHHGVRVNDLVILEAQDRIGGRLFTDKESSKVGNKYDLGASWFHDSLNNSTLRDLISDKDGGDFDLNKDAYFDDMDSLTFSRDVEGALDVNALKLQPILAELEKFIEMSFFDDLDRPDVSLKDIVKDYIQHRKPFLTDEQIKYVVSYMRYLELWHGISWDLLSAKYSVMDHQGRNLFFKKGYSTLVEAVSRKIPQERIHINTPVVAIHRNKSAGPIILKCSNGLEVRAKYVIVTVPLSILSLDAAHPQGITWNPPLPRSIQDATKSIHFGALGKVIFEFESVWWDNSQDHFYLLGSTEAENTHIPLSALPEPFTYPALIVNHSKVMQSDCGSLIILTQSPLTEYLESHPQEAWTYYKPMLEKMVLKDKAISNPINTITSKWTTNKYIRGSYSALHVNDDPSELIIQLAAEEPYLGIGATNIRFAGEHTIMDGAGCVHGAYSSGIREAMWVLNEVADSN